MRRRVTGGRAGRCVGTATAAALAMLGSVAAAVPAVAHHVPTADGATFGVRAGTTYTYTLDYELSRNDCTFGMRHGSTDSGVYTEVWVLMEPPGTTCSASARAKATRSEAVVWGPEVSTTSTRRARSFISGARLQGAEIAFRSYKMSCQCTDSRTGFAEVTRPATRKSVYYGGRMAPGGQVHSPDGGHRLVLQRDGDLVVRSAAGAVVWQAGTSGNPGSHLRYQDDGNVVVYDQNHSPLWATGTVFTSENGLLELRNDGTLVVVNEKHDVVWSSRAGAATSPAP